MFPERYSDSRMMRRCGQLGIPYETAIESSYAKRRGWKDGQFKVQYQDGKNGTIGWGNSAELIDDNSTTPHSYDEMMDLLKREPDTSDLYPAKDLLDTSTDSDSLSNNSLESLLNRTTPRIGTFILELRKFVLPLSRDIEEKFTDKMIAYQITSASKYARNGRQGLLWFNLSNASLFRLHLIKNENYDDPYNRLVPEGWGGYPEITFKEDELDGECFEYIKSLIKEALEQAAQRELNMPYSVKETIQGIPSAQACLLPLLRFAADGHQHSLNEVTDALADHFQLPPDTRMQLKASGGQTIFENRVAWARTNLKQAGLLEDPERGMFRITDDGKNVLESGEQKIDIKFLRRYPSFIAFLNRKRIRTTADTHMDTIPDAFEYSKSASELHSGGPITVKETIQEILDLQLVWNADTTTKMNKRGILVRNTMPLLLEILMSDCPVSIPNIAFEGSDGSGRKNRVPWVRIFSQKFSPKATDGWCVAIVFAFDGSEAYLSLGLGATQGKSFLPKNSEGIVEKINWARNIQLECNSNIEGLLKTIQLKDPGNLGTSYENSNVYAIKYKRDAVPDDEQIKNDIVRFLGMLGKIYQADQGTLSIQAQIVPARRYWWLNCNPAQWDVSKKQIGERQIYTSRNEEGNKRRMYECFESVKPGDEVMAYITSPERRLSSRLVITQGLGETLRGEGIEFEVVEHFSNHPTWEILKNDNRLAACEPLKSNQGSLFSLTENEFAIIREIIDGAKSNSDVPLAVISEKREPYQKQPEYTIADCSSETGLDIEMLMRWTRAIERKGQAILYGPPGTGKTYVAQHLAKHLVADSDGFFELVQFHPTYAYEDFIQGIRPMTGENGGLSYPLVPGRFLEFCKNAGQRKGRCVLILDEINRANLSRVFGELMYLLEYRDHSIPLAGGERFGIPENVRLIGTMNTADRSIALVDHALRRRFAFLELYPNYDVLERFHSGNGFQVAGLVATLKIVNRQIDDRHYMVGISFFLRNDLEEQLEDIWQMEIEPYLEEYFFDQPAKVEEFRWVKVKGTVAGA